MPSRKARGLCHCDSKLMGDGRCKYRCSPYADPDWLRLQAEKRRERDAHRRREEAGFITAADHKRMNAAIAKFDKLFARAQKRAQRAAVKSHGAGNRRKAS